MQIPPLQVITLEGWVEIMYYVMDAHSFYNFIYFILLIIVSTLFILSETFGVPAYFHHHAPHDNAPKNGPTA